jgi:hypothetical protein
LGKEPWVWPVIGSEEEKIALIVSANVKRRHLTVQQRAAVAAELSEKLTEAAKARQLAGTPASTDAKGKAVEQAAKMVGGVSPASVERAKRRMREDPEAHELAKAGKLPKAKPERITTPKRDGKSEVAAPKSGRVDPIEALRSLELALAGKFNADAWVADLSEWRKHDVKKTVHELRFKLHLIEEAFSPFGASADELDELDEQRARA